VFSIIIPLFNKVDYISKAIQSVLDQSFQDWELIIVNDGSTDGSELIAEQFQVIYPEKIHLIHQQNQGVALARNYGVEFAKCDFISFLDADDWWDSSFLNEIFFLIRDFPEGAVFGSRYFWVKNKRLSISLNHESDNFRGEIDYFKAYLFAWWMPLTSISTVVKKNIFLQEGGFHSKIKFGEDFNLWIRLALRYSIIYTNKPLAFYNQDVNVSNRALGWKIYSPGQHYIFHLETLEKEYYNHPNLKILLDGLRIQSLWKYRLSGKFQKEYQNEMDKVDWSNQGSELKKYYTWPILYWKIYWAVRRFGSKMKKVFYKSFLN
jgi:glycosyltransferase involved in cell wall biosynthesis